MFASVPQADAREHRLGHHLARRKEIGPGIFFHSVEPSQHRFHVEAIESHIGLELRPRNGRGHRGICTRSKRIRGNCGRAFGIAQVVDEDFSFTRGFGHHGRETIGKCRCQQLGDRTRESLGRIPVKRGADRNDDVQALTPRGLEKPLEPEIVQHFPKQAERVDEFVPFNGSVGIEVENKTVRTVQPRSARAPWVELQNAPLQQTDHR